MCGHSYRLSSILSPNAIHEAEPCAASRCEFSLRESCSWISQRVGTGGHDCQMVRLRLNVRLTLLRMDFVNVHHLDVMSPLCGCPLCGDKPQLDLIRVTRSCQHIQCISSWLTLFAGNTPLAGKRSSCNISWKSMQANSRITSPQRTKADKFVPV